MYRVRGCGATRQHGRLQINFLSGCKRKFSQRKKPAYLGSKSPFHLRAKCFIGKGLEIPAAP